MCAVAAADAIVPEQGEVFRVWFDGRKVNLSASPANDEVPVVSPDGSRVVFTSDRGLPELPSGRVRLFEVASSGGKATRLSSWLSNEEYLGGQIVWSPDSRRLAVVTRRPVNYGSYLFVIEPGQFQRRILTVDDPGFLLNPLWSPNGARISVDSFLSNRHATWVVTPSGRKVFQVPGDGAAWARTGDLAVQLGQKTIRVYGWNGKQKASFPGVEYVWSPEGNRIATLTQGQVQVRSANGRLLFTKPLSDLRLPKVGDPDQVLWVNATTLLITRPQSTSDGVGRYVDLTTGTTYGRTVGGLVSRDRKHTAKVDSVGNSTTLTVSRLNGTQRQVLVRRTPCRRSLATIEWLPDGRSLVYDFQCDTRG